MHWSYLRRLCFLDPLPEFAMRRGWAVSAALFVCFAVTASAQPTGDPIPAGFRSYIVTDERYAPRPTTDGKPGERDPRDRTNRMHDMVTELGLKPTLAIFTRNPPSADSPIAQLIKRVGELPVAQKKLLDRGKPISLINPFVIFLSLQKEYPEDEARDVEAQKVRDLATALKAPAVVYGLAASKSPQTDAWKIDANQDTVVILYNRMKTVQRWDVPAGQTLSEEQIQQILAAANQVSGVPK